MKEIVGIEFAKRIDRDGNAVFDDLRLTDCRFDNCQLSLVTETEKRSRVRNVYLRNCSASNCGIGPAVVEDSTIERLTTNDLLIAWAPILRHVRLIGDCGRIKVNLSAGYDLSPSEQAGFDAEREAVYASLDWALDISEATFLDLDVRGIPARLIRRDPSCQFVVTREAASQPEWRKGLSKEAQDWLYAIDIFLEDADEDRVLVVPRHRSKKRREALLEGLRDLRETGVLESG